VLCVVWVPCKKQKQIALYTLQSCNPVEEGALSRPSRFSDLHRFAAVGVTKEYLFQLHRAGVLITGKYRTEREGAHVDAYRGGVYSEPSAQRRSKTRFLARRAL
jgi:hypothetical protein